MTVQELLDELQLKYPHSYTTTQVVNRMDRLQKRIYRQLNTISSTSLTIPLAGVSQVAWSTYNVRKIRSFLVDNIAYPFWTPEEPKPARYYYYENGFINFYPPTERSNLVVTTWENDTPATLSSGSLSASPDLDTDYHMLLVYGVAKEIAEDLRDGSMATAFAYAYNDLYNELHQQTQNPESYVVKEIAWG